MTVSLLCRWKAERFDAGPGGALVHRDKASAQISGVVLAPEFAGAVNALENVVERKKRGATRVIVVHAHYEFRENNPADAEPPPCVSPPLPWFHAVN